MEYFSQAQEGHQAFVERERDLIGGTDESTDFFRTLKSKIPERYLKAAQKEIDLIDLHLQEAKEKEEIFQS